VKHFFSPNASAMCIPWIFRIPDGGRSPKKKSSILGVVHHCQKPLDWNRRIYSVPVVLIALTECKFDERMQQHIFSDDEKCNKILFVVYKLNWLTFLYPFQNKCIIYFCMQ
jgi:hypothetical protein